MYPHAPLFPSFLPSNLLKGVPCIPDRNTGILLPRNAGMISSAQRVGKGEQCSELRNANGLRDDVVLVDRGLVGTA